VFPAILNTFLVSSASVYNLSLKGLKLLHGEHCINPTDGMNNFKCQQCLFSVIPYSAFKWIPYFLSVYYGPYETSHFLCTSLHNAYIHERNFKLILTKIYNESCNKGETRYEMTVQ